MRFWATLWSRPGCLGSKTLLCPVAGHRTLQGSAGQPRAAALERPLSVVLTSDGLTTSSALDVFRPRILQGHFVGTNTFGDGTEGDRAFMANPLSRGSADTTLCI